MDSFIAQKTTYPLLLNLGCGYQPLPGFVNVDYIKHDKCDLVVDLNRKWPWNDNSVDQIFCSHVLEHLDDTIHFMKEAHRVLKVGGYIEIRVPHGWSDAAMEDPTHKRQFFLGTFMAFCDGYTPKKTYNPQHNKDRWPFSFELVDCVIGINDWVKKLPFWKLYVKQMLKRFLNVAWEIKVVLKKQKI